MTRVAQHPQPWCLSCNRGTCTGEHFAYGQVAASNSAPELLHEHAALPLVSAGIEWIEWESNTCAPSIYVEVGDEEARMNLAEAEEILAHLKQSVGRLRALATGDHHLLCDCAEATARGSDG